MPIYVLSMAAFTQSICDRDRRVHKAKNGSQFKVNLKICWSLLWKYYSEEKYPLPNNR